MANIIKRGDGFQVKIRRVGRPIISGTFNTKADAQAWAREQETKLDRGIYKDAKQASTTTLQFVIERYIAVRLPQLKSNSSTLYRLQALIRDSFSKNSLTNLTPIVVSAWRDKRIEEGRKGGTVNRDLSLISALVNFARKDLMIDCVNPISGIRRPKNERGRDRRLEDGEQERLLHELADHSAEDERDDEKKYRRGSRNPWALPFAQFAIETAMRRSEILSLRWPDVDLDKRIALLRETKNGTSRKVPLSSAAIAILKSLPREDECDVMDYVFKTTSDAIKKVFERAKKRALLDDLRLHDLRHEATSRLATKLPNVIELSSVTGHKDLRMLQRYYHPRAEDLALKLG